MPKITEILLKKISEKSEAIDAWFAEKFRQNPALIYNSVDLRHAGFKIAPVDTNCFPAGFNNLSEVSKNLAKKTVDDFLNKNFPSAKKILITPENHTQNLRYLENVRNLQEILSGSREVLIGSLIENLTEVTKIDLENGHFIELYPVKSINHKLVILDAKRRGSLNGEEKSQEILGAPLATKDGENGFIPDLIVMNNDLTSGIPEVLQNIATPIVPAVQLGWHQRTKSQHFTIYNQLAAEISALIDLDPWLISTFDGVCHDINFKDQLGIEPLAKAVDDLIKKTAEKYRQYGINEQPYCYVKADIGTYGIAVWSVASGDEVLHINKKERNKMNMLKGSVQNTSVIIQEGVKTIDKINSEIAEPMIYLMNGEVVGNLFRVNNSRDEKISLNSTGASFFDLTNLSENQIQLGADKNNIKKVYALIARLAALAAAVENKLAAAVEQQQMLSVK